MSITESILKAYTEKFHDDFIMLVQQRESRLEGTVRTDPDELDGKAGFFDRMSAITDQEDNTRFGDTKIVVPEFSRRRIVMRDFNLPQLIDKKDRRRMIHGDQLPQKYLENAIAAYNRRKDDLIIAAISGDAQAVDANGSVTPVPLPNAQKVQANSAGLTKAKLLAAREILFGADVDPDAPLICPVTWKQQTDLLTITEATNADYVQTKPLTEGKIANWLGITFVPTNRLTLDGNGNRRVPLYTQEAIGLAWGQEAEVDIGPRRDKQNALQIYVDYALDATRVEDEKVVEIACVES